MSGHDQFTLPQAVTVREAAAVHGAMLAALRGSRALCLDCSDVGEADITLFQLLAAAKASAARAGIDLTITWPQDGRLGGLLALCGFAGRLA